MDADKKVCNTFYETAKPTNLESSLIKSECLKRTLDGLVTHHMTANDDLSKDEPKSVHDEKADVSPEISNKKSNDTSPLTDSNCSNSITPANKMNKSFSVHTFENSYHHHSRYNHKPFEVDKIEKESDDRSEVNKNMAFTIDFGSGKQVDEQRQKNLLERFQNRHRRGVSLSKVEDEMNESTSSSVKLRSPASAKFSRKNSRDVIESPQKPTSAGGVRLREKTKTNQLRDASKRHSWSPRSSMVEPTQPIKQQPQQLQQQSKMAPSRHVNVNPLERPLKLHALTKADVKPMPPKTLNIACLQTPLVNKESHLNDDGDQISEAGTYTLDGDNYTEEQKEKMNIDKLNSDRETELMQTKLEINESDSNIETDLEVIDLDAIPSTPPTQSKLQESSIRRSGKGNRKNILEVSFYHQEPTSSSSNKQKISYLEKLKSRVKNIGNHKSTKSLDSDVGTFTSVTTSGILSYKPSLEMNPNLKRKNSLTKSQIDSSEYVQGLQRTMTEKVPITDTDKSMAVATGFQLNIFPQSSPTKSRKESVGSSNTSISTAATKDDWIQEWARNAREYSRHKRTPGAPVMSNSYNFEGSLEKSDQFGYFSDDVMSRSDCKPKYEEFGDNLDKFHGKKNHHHKKPPTTPENNEDRSINNLSDQEPLSISSARSRRVLRDFDLNKNEPPRVSSAFNIKPPMSPCRIPSPIGTVSSRQKRYGSSKMLYGSDTDLTNDTELYLQRTAAAISTLQHLHRKNSLRNSSLQNSPISPMSPTRPPIVQSNKSNNATTSAVYHPPHTRAQSVTRTSIHKRNSSLDSTRFNAAGVMSTSLQTNNNNTNNNNYLINDNNNKKSQQQQHHSRHNSYDGMHKHTTNIKYSQFDQTDDDDYESMPINNALPERPQNLLIKQKQLQQQPQQSPIKRSSSFSIKAHEVQSPARVSSGTPKMHNKFVKTVSAPAHGGMKIQKSASSTCFKQITSQLDDDDYENEFYINDDDDLNPNQFTPSDESEEEQRKFSLTMVNDRPMSNTRYNKTFLMRCEQSKSKVTSGGATTNKPLGVVACPNTPELPRRDAVARTSMRDRASMPRDSSLNRVLDKKPLSAGAKSSSTNNTGGGGGGGGGKVTSKYLDISKYKAERGNNFLKRDESKSYLIREVKKSSSSACLQNFQRDNQNRASSRSSGGGTSSRPSSAAAAKKKEVKNTKEIELAMWKRRASYDPLKAAAEGKRKAEEAKRLAQHQQMVLSSEGSSSAMRSSKSYHSGAAGEWLDDDSEDDSEFDDEN